MFVFVKACELIKRILTILWLDGLPMTFPKVQTASVLTLWHNFWVGKWNKLKDRSAFHTNLHRLYSQKVEYTFHNIYLGFHNIIYGIINNNFGLKSFTLL